MLRRILFLTMVLSAASSLGFSQGTAISKSDFESTIYSAERLVSQQVRREKSSNNTFSNRNNSADETKSVIEEFVPYGRYRSLTKATRDGKASQDETIIIDSKFYWRSGHGQWSVSNGGIGGGRSPVPDDIEQTYWKFEKIIFEGKTVTLYKSIIKFPKSRYGNDKTPETYTEQYWIADNGRLMKTSQDVDIVGTKKSRSSVTTYEYDASIKIEAPIM